jgi:Icc protein
MPVSLPAYPSRRRFLREAAQMSGVAIVASRSSIGSTLAPAWYAWLSDTHIATLPSTDSRGQNMAANLDKVVAGILAEPTPPRAAIVDGDLALLDGQPGDYTNLVERLSPLRKAGIPIHLTLGNHDDRDAFRKALNLAPERGSPPAILAKHVMVREHPDHRWILLDSLDAPNVTPGVLGQKQLEWLAGALDAKPAVPTILFVHHNLPSRGEMPLTDSQALLDVVEPRAQVKALVYGHTHRWERSQQKGIHWVNLPAVAYSFQDDQPLGWCRFETNSTGATLTLHAIGGVKEKDGERLELAWRPG